MYRVQVLGPSRLAMHWQRHKVGAAHWRDMAVRGEKMPIAIALGGDAASTYSASAPLPPNIDEYIFAGFLRRKPVKLAKAVTNDLFVPAEADIVIEGYIDRPSARSGRSVWRPHWFLFPCDDYPAVNITAITTRKDAVYPTTIVGRPPMEDYYLGHATERIFCRCYD